MSGAIKQEGREKRFSAGCSVCSITKETLMRNARTPLAVGIALAVAVPATVFVTSMLDRRRPRAAAPLHGRCVPTLAPSPVPPEHPHAVT